MDYDWYRNHFEKSLLYYNPNKAYELLTQFTQEETALDFIDKILVKVLISIGKQWDEGKIALAQVYMSSRLCEQMTETLLPTEQSVMRTSPPMAIVVLSDHHVLGKKIVKSVIRSSGYTIADYGSGLEVPEIIERVQKDKIAILIVSVLMYPSALKVKALTQALHELNLPVKVLVGGAPFMIDQDLWKQVGADAMGYSAAEDIPIIERWIEEDFEHA